MAPGRVYTIIVLAYVAGAHLLATITIAVALLDTGGADHQLPRTMPYGGF